MTFADLEKIAETQKTETYCDLHFAAAVHLLGLDYSTIVADGEMEHLDPEHNHD